ncbi:MAG: hypothetical protein V3V28_09595 [Polaribacter sp.]|uniref:hypothetical protein n=1 Tax=Polaribacter sp. TaxID=1920175 RepID=UPI002F3548DB
MKKGVLILLGMFMMVSTVEAKNGNYLPNNNWVNYSYNNAVNFTERGIEFFIFTNGEFDFDTNYNDTYYDYNGRRTRSSGVKIDRDYRGRVRRIGNVFVNYDYRGNVSRIGNVYMRYFRGNLTKVGNLRISYNRGGYPEFYGHVKDNFYYDNGFRINLNIGDICNYNDTYFYRSDFRKNYSQIREDNNYYYYRANTNAKIGKRSKILKRRKPVATKVNRNTVKKRSNTTYRKPATTRKNTTRSLETKRGTNLNTRRTVDNNKRTNVRKSTTLKSDRKVKTNKKPIVRKRTATSTREKVASKKRENKSTTTRRRN